MYQQRRSMPSGEPIPENYSGNAFRYPPIGSLGVTPPDEALASPLTEETREPEVRSPVAIVPLGREEVRREDGGGILRLLGSEEWLLLGLCLLLMGEGGPRIGGEGQKNDLLPYLLLLLFCG